MARTTNEVDFQEKRQLIIQTALKFIYSVGYDEMSIQNILDDLSISKGAFYHYFSSKEDLLLGLIDELGDSIYEQINPIVDDPNLTGLEKMNAYFEKAGMIKMDRAEYLIPITRVWYDDKNILVREKLIKKSQNIISPILNRFIQQGISEGIFSNPYPERIGEVIFQIFVTMGDAVVIEMVKISSETFDSERFYQTIDVYSDIFERILQAPKGSIKFISKETLGVWINLFQDEQNINLAGTSLVKE
jgi:AcrR family transcriptional regulator